MKRKVVAVLAICLFLLVAVGALAIALLINRAEDRYEKEAVLAWTNLQVGLQSADDLATKQNSQTKQYDVDFTRLQDSLPSIKAEVDKLKTEWELKSAPRKFREFNAAFVSLLVQSSASVDSLLNNSLTWDSREMFKLGDNTKKLVQTQNNAYNAWPAGRKALLAADQKIFANVTIAFNATRLAREKAKKAERIARTDAEERAQQEGQQISNSHDFAVEEMRAIMREYVTARSYFNTTMEAGSTNPYVFGEQCVANRCTLINRLKNLDLPNEFYRETRRLFVSGINDAIEAIRIKCSTGNGHSEAARSAAGKIRQAQERLGM